MLPRHCGAAKAATVSAISARPTHVNHGHGFRATLLFFLVITGPLLTLNWLSPSLSLSHHSFRQPKKPSLDLDNPNICGSGLFSLRQIGFGVQRRRRLDNRV